MRCVSAGPIDNHWKLQKSTPGFFCLFVFITRVTKPVYQSFLKYVEYWVKHSAIINLFVLMTHPTSTKFHLRN